MAVLYLHRSPVMGIGHTKQQNFFTSNWKHALSHGGELRKKRAGRGVRPLSTKEPLHLVFKVNRERLRHGTLRAPVTHTLISRIVRRYSKRFFVKVEQISIQGDHCHLLIRAPRRSKFKDFFRVVAGQIAQVMEKEGLLNPKVKTKVMKTSVKPSVTDTPTALRADRATSAKRVKHGACGSERDCHGPRDTHRSDKVEAAFSQKVKGKIKGTKLWRHRPFTRVIRGHKAYKIVRDYIQLNELEAEGKVPYRKKRLRGLSAGEWELLWC